MVASKKKYESKDDKMSKFGKEAPMSSLPNKGTARSDAHMKKAEHHKAKMEHHKEKMHHHKKMSKKK